MMTDIIETRNIFFFNTYYIPGTTKRALHILIHEISPKSYEVETVIILIYK